MVSVEPLGGEGEAVVRALCSGDQAELLESSWTELGGAPRRLSFGGPSATLETRWTQEHGLPGLTGLRVQGGPWFPP